MDHANAMSLLSDYAAGRLAAERAQELERHVHGCEECREALAAMNDVRQEIQDHGAALFTEHPRAEDLARWAQTPLAMNEQASAAIEAHARACPTCSREAAAAREAARTAWRRALPARLARADETPWSGWLRIVPWGAAILLAFPAYLGLVELPRERARDLLEAPAPAPSHRLPAPWSGGAKALVLSEPARSGGFAPSVRPEPGQPYIPIVLGIEGLPSTGELLLTILRADGSTSWETESPASQILDPVNRVATILVPSASLPAGDYRLEARRAPRSDVLFSASFRVETATIR